MSRQQSVNTVGKLSDGRFKFGSSGQANDVSSQQRAESAKFPNLAGTTGSKTSIPENVEGAEVSSGLDDSRDERSVTSLDLTEEEGKGGAGGAGDKVDLGETVRNKKTKGKEKTDLFESMKTQVRDKRRLKKTETREDIPHRRISVASKVKRFATREGQIDEEFSSSRSGTERLGMPKKQKP